MKVYAVDFFGDWDLPQVTMDFRAVANKNPEHGRVKNEKPMRFQEIMVKLARELVDQYADIEVYIMGSGFDDDPRFVDEINSFIPVIGNTSDALGVLRDNRQINEVAMKAGFQIPMATPATNLVSLQDVPMPCVLTPDYSSGGLSKFLVQNTEDLQANLDAIGPESNIYSVENFIPGRPMSCTFIATGLVNKIVAINDQIIGDMDCYAPAFYYCGNVTPSGAPPEILEEALRCCQTLIDELPVRGMNGIDFVAGEKGLFFMELNPRVTGSLGPIELALRGPVLADIFLESEDLFKKVYVPVRAASKHVLYAPREISPAAQRLLRTAAWVEDIPLGETMIQIGEPICTVLATEKTPIAAREKGTKLTGDVYEVLLSK